MRRAFHILCGHIGDPGPLLFGGPIFTDPIPIFYIPFLQLKWICIFLNVKPPWPL